MIPTPPPACAACARLAAANRDLAAERDVTVEINGTTYALTDIRLRMLTPRELARAQGFPDTYHLIGTQAQQIARIGNSVCPPIARALVAANLPPLQEARA